MARKATLAVTFVLVMVLAFLTLYVMFTNGISMLTLISFLVLAILGFGIFGALGEPPRRGGDL